MGKTLWDINFSTLNVTDERANGWGTKYTHADNLTNGIYKADGQGSTPTFSVNAVDIDWNGALVGTEVINTTGDLLEWIQNGQTSSSVNVPAIQSTEVKYAIGGSTRPADDAFILDEVPTTVGDGEYVWCRTRVVYNDGKSTTSYSWFKPSKNPKSIVSTVTTYAVTSTGTQPNDNAFTYSEVPTLQFGQYLWSKTVITYSDGDSSKFYSCSYVGKDGDTVAGTNWYLHLAYANSADGATDFSTTYFSGALYIGTCVNETEADPTVYSEYEWKRFRGEQGDPGQNGKSTVTSICFTRSESQPETPVGGTYTNPIPDEGAWSDGIPAGTATLWSTSRIFTSDGTAPQQNSWTVPMRAQDSQFYDVEFAEKYSNGSLSDTVPPDPNNDNLGEIWFDPQRNSDKDFTNMYWRAERKKTNETWSDWVKVRIKGEQGIPGTSPLQLYTWIKYAGNVTISDGTVTNVGDIDDSPLRTDNTYREYIGIAENKTSPIESNVWSDYKWTKLSQTTIINNDGGTYTWIMYADSLEADGYPVEMYSASDDRFGINTKYVGFAWNKESNSPSPDPRDYTWVLRDYAPAVQQVNSGTYILDPMKITFTGDDVYLRAYKQSWYTDDGEEKTKTDQLKFYNYTSGEDVYSIQYKIGDKWYWGLEFEEENSQTGDTVVKGYGIPKEMFTRNWPERIPINIREDLVNGKSYTINERPRVAEFTVPVEYHLNGVNEYKLVNTGLDYFNLSSEDIYYPGTIDIRAQKRASDGNTFIEDKNVTIQYYINKYPAGNTRCSSYIGMSANTPDGIYHSAGNDYAPVNIASLLDKDNNKVLPLQWIYFVIIKDGGVVAEYRMYCSGYEPIDHVIVAEKRTIGSTVKYKIGVAGKWANEQVYKLTSLPFVSGNFEATLIQYYFDWDEDSVQTITGDVANPEITVPETANVLNIRIPYIVKPSEIYNGNPGISNGKMFLNIEKPAVIDIRVDGRNLVVTDSEGASTMISGSTFANETTLVKSEKVLSDGRTEYTINATNSLNTDDDFSITLTSGQKGDSAVVYKLTPSVDKIVGYKDGTYSVDSVKCGYLKTVGLISTLSVADASVMMYRDDNPAEIYLRTGQNQNDAIGISPEIFEKQIKFVLKVGDLEVDSVTIPIIHEGLDAEYHTYEIRPIGPTSYNTYDALTNITSPTWKICEITNGYSETENGYLDHAYYKYTTKDGSYTGLGFAYGNLGLFCTQENINVKDLTSLTIYLTDEIQEDADNTVGNIISTHTVQIVHSPKKYYLRPNTTQVKFDNQTGNYVPSTVSCEKIMSTYDISGETVEQTDLGSIWYLIDNRALSGATLYDGSNLDINEIGAHNSVSFIYSRDPSSVSSDMILDRVDIPITYNGASGTTPHIGTGNMWYIGNTSTGVKATGDAGRGIASTQSTQTTIGDDKYTQVSFVLTDNSAEEIYIPNGKDGRGIESITTEETSTGNNAVKITLTDGTETQFTVLNGTDGIDGDDGIDATVTGQDTRYKISDSGTQRPDFTSDSLSTMPTVPQGKWLWTKNVIEWNDGETSDIYTAVRNPNDGAPGAPGIDGGSVESYRIIPDRNTLVVDSSGNLLADSGWDTYYYGDSVWNKQNRTDTQDSVVVVTIDKNGNTWYTPGASLSFDKVLQDINTWEENNNSTLTTWNDINRFELRYLGRDDVTFADNDYTLDPGVYGDTIAMAVVNVEHLPAPASVRQFKGISTSYSNTKKGSVVRIDYETAGQDDMIDVLLDDGSYNAEYVDVGSCYYDDQDGHIYVAEQNGWKDLGELKKSEDSIKMLVFCSSELMFAPFINFVELCDRMDIPVDVTVVDIGNNDSMTILREFDANPQKQHIYKYTSGGLWTEHDNYDIRGVFAKKYDTVIFELPRVDYSGIGSSSGELDPMLRSIRNAWEQYIANSGYELMYKNVYVLVPYIASGDHIDVRYDSIDYLKYQGVTDTIPAVATLDLISKDTSLDTNLTLEYTWYATAYSIYMKIMYPLNKTMPAKYIYEGVVSPKSNTTNFLPTANKINLNDYSDNGVRLRIEGILAANNPKGVKNNEIYTSYII